MDDQIRQSIESDALASARAVLASRPPVVAAPPGVKVGAFGLDVMDLLPDIVRSLTDTAVGLVDEAVEGFVDRNRDTIVRWVSPAAVELLDRIVQRLSGPPVVGGGD